MGLDPAVSEEGAKLGRPAWYKAAVWMGIDFFGLSRLLLRNRFRVQPGSVPRCLVDLWFSLFNTALAGVQAFHYGPRLKGMRLAGDPIFIVGHWQIGRAHV
jgi:hypothetical protein